MDEDSLDSEEDEGEKNASHENALGRVIIEIWRVSG